MLKIVQGNKLMILVDFSQIVNASYYVAQKEFDDVDEDAIMHLSFNSLRFFNKKFKKKYGELVVCCDHYSWRKNQFPEYKAGRKAYATKEAKEEREFINRSINSTIQAVKDHFPFRMLHIKGCEGDDIIGTLSMVCHKKNLPCLIISTDKDFLQMNKFGASQYSPIKNEMMNYTKQELKMQYITHLFKGDGGDGIPNIFSDDDQLVNPDKRQPPIPKVFLDHGVENSRRLVEFLSELESHPEPKLSRLGNKYPTEFILKNFKRNLKLIDLRGTPKKLKLMIIQEYKDATISKEYEMTDFLLSKGMGKLLENTSDFFI